MSSPTVGRTVNPAADLLTSPDAGQILAIALSASGVNLESWNAVDVHARPGAETSVGYNVVAGGTPMYLVASTVRLDDAERERAKAVKLESEIGTVHVWRRPHDPRLPSLAQVCEPTTFEAMLADYYGAPVELGKVTMRVYRPLRRAVVRAELSVDGSPRTVFVKVVRPARAESVCVRHTMVGTALAPPCVDLGDGVLLIERAPGRSLARALVDDAAAGDHALLPAPREFADVLQRLPSIGTTLPPRRSIPSRLQQFVQAAVNIGLDAARVQALADTVEAVLADTDPGPVVTTHGDFNVANIYVDGVPGDVRIVSLIDLDTLGPGHMVDDLACLISHLVVLPTLNPIKYAKVGQYVERLIAEFGSVTHPAGLHARTAAVVLSLASGCSVPERACQWFEVAESFARESATFMRDVS